MGNWIIKGGEKEALEFIEDGWKKYLMMLHDRSWIQGNSKIYQCN